MHTRGVSKRIAKDQETEEDRREEEAEVVTDIEMEQQASDKEDAQGDQPDKAVTREEPNWQDMMKFMAEQFRKQEENSKKQEEYSRIQKKRLNKMRTLMRVLRQINE